MGLLSQLKSLVSGTPSVPMPVDLAQLPTEQLQRSLAAGYALNAAVTALEADGRSVVDVVLNGNAFAVWQMYPWQGGILDQRSNAQYFYHAHEGYKGEHGHFHTFYYHQRKLVHLVAIGMDTRARRINQLYTFNRWGPGDHYYPAERLRGFLPRFRIAPNQPLDARLHRFVSEALVLFRAEIEWLFDERDATFARYRAEHNGASPYEDRDLEITSAVPVDVDVQLARIVAELERRGEPLPERPAADAGAGRSKARRDGDGKAPAQAEPDAVLDGEPRVEPIAERATAQLKRSYEAGLALREIDADLRAAGGSVVDAVLHGKEHEPWAMYPWETGVTDKKTRSQYFYHSHPQSPEHGHFHVFYHHRSQLAHLGAIAMDNAGEPVSLFTVNRWVTDDFFLPAAKLKSYLPQFRITTDSFDQRVGAYVRNMLLLYQAELGALLEARDRVFDAYRAAHGGQSPFEDRDLEVTSALEIDVAAHMAALEAELRRRGEW